MKSLFPQAIAYFILFTLHTGVNMAFSADVTAPTPAPPIAPQSMASGPSVELKNGATDTDLEYYKRVGHIDHVETLKIQDAKITAAGFAILREFSGLKRLVIMDTPLRNDDLKGLSAMNQLETLALIRTGITGGLQPIAALTNLKLIQLSGNHTDDQELIHFSKLPNLRILFLGDETLRDKGLVNIGQCSGLISLHLNDSAVTGAGLAHLGNLSNLGLLNLMGTQIEDKGFASITELKGLSTLMLSNTAIDDDAVRCLGSLNKLTALHLDGTRVTNAGIYYLDTLPSLRTLRLRNTLINETDMGGILGLQSIQILDVTNSAFHLNAESARGLASVGSLRSLILGKDQIGPEALRLLHEARPDIDVTVAYALRQDRFPFARLAPVLATPRSPK